jgi:MFS family permease
VLPFVALLMLGAGPFEMAVLAAAAQAPGLVAGPLAGVWVDRLSRRPLLIAADLGRAALWLSVPAAAALGLLRIEHVYLVSFAGGLLALLFDVAYVAYLPAVVGRERLVDANAKLAASASVAEAGSFSVGGWIVQLAGAHTATVVDALTFLASALLLLGIREPGAPPARPAQRSSVRTETIEGLNAMLRHPLLRTLAVSALLLGLQHGVIGAVILLFCTRDLGLSPGVIGLVFAVGGVTSLLGAAVAGRVVRRLGLGPTLTAAAAVAVLGTACVGLAGGPPVVAVALLIASQLVNDPAMAVFQVNEVSIRQAVTPDALQGRVTGAVRFVAVGAAVAGALVAGVLSDAAGVRAALVLGVILGCALAVWLACSPLRAIRTLPAATDARGA